VRPTVLALVAITIVSLGADIVGRQSPAALPAPSAAGRLVGAPTLPSPRNASYTIDVRLDHAARRLTGRETIRWRNITSRPTRELQLHLYWNAWRDANSTWLRERHLAGSRAPRPDGFGSIDISALRVRVGNGSWDEALRRIDFIAPDDGNADDRTVVRVPLESPVEPDGTADLSIEWTSRVPKPFARTGYVGDYYFIAQWFPKLGVLEESGWNTHQFHSATEFFSDYGIYDVDIRVPRGFIVGATGCATVPETTPLCSTSVGTDNGDGTTTHRFHAEDVHDFAWTASPDFLDLSRAFEHPALPRTQMRLLLQPEHRAQADRYFAIVADTLRLYGEWFGAYPYGYLTIVDPAFQSFSDGMEYPTLFTGRARWLAPSAVQTPEMTTAHEAGHQWWYAMVGSNEFEHAWLDEGINNYTTARLVAEVFPHNRVEARFFGGFIPWTLADVPFTRLDNDRLPGYRDNAEADVPATPTWRYWPSTATAITYNKTSLWLHTLERHLGWPTMRRVLATYFERWRFRHPKPEDFFAVVREVSGQDLTWFFDEAYGSSNTFDYGVQTLLTDQASPGRYRTTVVVRRHGEAVFPVEVVIRFEDGTTTTEQWDGRERRAIFQYERAARATSAVVDPRRVLVLDVNYANNSRTLAPAASKAGTKWALIWMLWLQQLMLSYGFFS
jgi:hypothetical protein